MDKAAFFQRLVIVLALGFICGTLANIGDYLKDIRNEIRQEHKS